MHMKQALSHTRIDILKNVEQSSSPRRTTRSSIQSSSHDVQHTARRRDRRVGIRGAGRKTKAAGLAMASMGKIAEICRIGHEN